MVDTERVKAAVVQFLQAIGEDPNRPGLLDTPRRVADYWAELLEGSQYTNKQIAQMYNKSFEVSGDSMVVRSVSNVYSHCEHHLALMYNMDVIVAYLPVQVGPDQYKVLGLSKIPRIVKMCAKRLQLQEKLAADIAECISIATGSPDVYVNIEADHACVSARGAQSEGTTNVTKLTGKFINDSALRSEVERKIRR